MSDVERLSPPAIWAVVVILVAIELLGAWATYIELSDRQGPRSLRVTPICPAQEHH